MRKYILDSFHDLEKQPKELGKNLTYNRLNEFLIKERRNFVKGSH